MFVKKIAVKASGSAKHFNKIRSELAPWVEGKNGRSEDTLREGLKKRKNGKLSAFCG